MQRRDPPTVVVDPGVHSATEAAVLRDGVLRVCSGVRERRLEVRVHAEGEDGSKSLGELVYFILFVLTTETNLIKK